jgi:hypothetical protein
VSAEIWASFQEVCILKRLEGNPGANVQRIAAAEGISVPLVWRILHVQSLYPYNLQQVQALTPPEHCAKGVLCEWLLTNCCVVITQFVANILFTEEVGFTRDGIMTFHNTYV